MQPFCLPQTFPLVVIMTVYIPSQTDTNMTLHHNMINSHQILTGATNFHLGPLPHFKRSYTATALPAFGKFDHATFFCNANKGFRRKLCRWLDEPWWRACRTADSPFTVLQPGTETDLTETMS